MCFLGFVVFPKCSFQGDLLEQGDACNLKNGNHWRVDVQVFFCDCDKQVDDECDPDLGAHGVVARDRRRS